jgi:hypothetical protein
MTPHQKKMIESRSIFQSPLMINHATVISLNHLALEELNESNY